MLHSRPLTSAVSVIFISISNFVLSKSSYVGDGAIGIDEYRLSCVSRMAYTDIEEIDAAYKTLLNVSSYHHV